MAAGWATSRALDLQGQYQTRVYPDPYEETGIPTEGTSTQNYYDSLGLDSQASSGDIKAAFYNLSKEFHPDKNPNDPEALTRFQEISTAHNILGNPSLRRQYDKGIMGRLTSVADQEMSSHQYEGQYFVESRARLRSRYTLDQMGRENQRSTMDKFMKQHTNKAFLKRKPTQKPVYMPRSLSRSSREEPRSAPGLGLILTVVVVGMFGALFRMASG
eukprot:maker-scaffold589_size129586-snap-gene-0.36 protein:Tk07334 transcript:maker-scaffold589_size129586-snap-gene-0.36-mRNA-1 annotation:"j domain-containing protein"